MSRFGNHQTHLKTTRTKTRAPLQAERNPVKRNRPGLRESDDAKVAKPPMQQVWLRVQTRLNITTFMHACMQTYIHPSVCPPVHPSVRPSIHPSIQPASQPAIHPSIHPCLAEHTWPKALQFNIASQIQTWTRKVAGKLAYPEQAVACSAAGANLVRCCHLPSLRRYPWPQWLWSWAR